MVGWCHSLLCLILGKSWLLQKYHVWNSLKVVLTGRTRQPCQTRRGFCDFLPTSGHGNAGLQLKSWFLVPRLAHHGWHTALHCEHAQAEPNTINVWRVKSKPHLWQKFDKKMRLWHVERVQESMVHPSCDSETKNYLKKLWCNKLWSWTKQTLSPVTVLGLLRKKKIPIATHGHIC